MQFSNQCCEPLVMGDGWTQVDFFAQKLRGLARLTVAAPGPFF